VPQQQQGEFRKLVFAGLPRRSLWPRWACPAVAFGEGGCESDQRLQPSPGAKRRAVAARHSSIERRRADATSPLGPRYGGQAISSGS